jgi:RNA polymerase sigma factor (sigma-70 family)
MTPATARGLVRRVGPDPDPPADADLVGRFTRHADPAAFAALVRRHGPMVLAACRRMLPDPADADDAFQAVFLVLVRKAGAVRPPGAVGGWLHGVAVRTAQKARVAAARRRRREMSVASNPGRASAAAVVPGSPEHAELRAVLDEELARLPDPLRAAVVLCDLGGRTRAEAAADLGCPEGTVAARVHRARKLLADRLARRGVTAPAALAVSSAAVPGELYAAVTGFATGGPVPPAVRALAEGVVRGLAASPLALAFAAVAAVALVAGAGVLWAAGGPRPESAAAGPEPAPPAAEKAGPAYSVGYAGDGSKFVYLGGGKATVRDAATKAERFTTDGEFAQFSADGKTLFVLEKDEFRTLDAATGKVLGAASRNKPKSSLGGRTAVFTADGARRAEHDGWTAHLAGDFANGPPVMEGQGPVNLGPLIPNYGHGVAFSPDGAKLAGTHSITPDFKQRACLGVWEVGTGRRLGTIDHGVNNVIASFAWSPSGAEIAVGINGGIVLHDAATLKESRHIPVTRGVSLTALAWSADGRTLAAAEEVWDGENGQGGPKAIRVAARLWDVASGKEVRRIDGFPDNLPVVALAFRPDGKELACGAGFLPGAGSASNFPQPAADAVGLRLIPLDPPAEQAGPVYSVGYSGDGFVYVGGGKATVRDAATKAERFTADAEFAHFSGDGKQVFVFAGDRFRTLDAVTGKELNVVDRAPRPTDPIRWAVASPDGKIQVEADGLAHAVTGFFPPQVAVLFAGQLSHNDIEDKLTPRVARAGAFSSDGKRYAGIHAADRERTKFGLLGVWDIGTTGDRVGTIARGKAFWERAVAFAWSPDGKQIAVGFGDGTRVYDADTFAERRRIDSGPTTAG